MKMSREREETKKKIMYVWVGLLILPFIFLGYTVLYKEIIFPYRIYLLLSLLYGFVLLMVSLMLIHVTVIDRRSD